MKIFRTTFFTLAFLTACLAMARTESVGKHGLFLTANELYHSGEYEKALEAYDKLAQTNPNGAIYYNMGNCYFRLGQVGNAVVNFRRALGYDPRNSEILANLRYAREEAKDALEDKSKFNIFKILLFWSDDLTWRELMIITGVFYAVFMICLSIRIFRKFDYQGFLISGVAVIFFLFASSAGWRYYMDHYQPGGAITHKEVTIHSASDINSVVLFKLHDGAEFRVLSERDNWLEIELKDKKKGWVVKKFTGLI